MPSKQGISLVDVLSGHFGGGKGGRGQRTEKEIGRIRINLQQYSALPPPCPADTLVSPAALRRSLSTATAAAGVAGGCSVSATATAAVSASASDEPAPGRVARGLVAGARS